MAKACAQIADPELRACLESLAARIAFSNGPPEIAPTIEADPIPSSAGVNRRNEAASSFLLAGAAALASAACNAEKRQPAAAGGDSATSGPVAQAPRPANGDWSQAVVATHEGGFLMGNPNAEVKLVEFGSMTCPHCAEFDETGLPPLIDKYVKNGQVSFEFRNYVRDPYDIAASLVARCNGAQSFFPLTRGLFKDQQQLDRQAAGRAAGAAAGAADACRRAAVREIAKLAGFQQWAAMRGVPIGQEHAVPGRPDGDQPAGADEQRRDRQLP